MSELGSPPRAISRRTFLHKQSVLTLAALGAPFLARARRAENASLEPLRVCVWCEGTAPIAIYPNEIDGAISEGLRDQGSLTVVTARLAQDACGLSDATLDQTDVMVWWGRLKHDEVTDDRAEAVSNRVRAGKLGLVALHGSYASKPFQALMGKACEPTAWRDEGKPERIKIEAPEHPIARGVEPFTIPRTQMFSEPFQVPEPETVVLVSTWESGESFRSGLTWTIDQGRVAYLRPGDDSFPVLFHPSVRQVLANAVQWAGRRM